ncbi:MAG TPA: SCO family protein [Xanthomonadaceae bacterium]
MPRAHMRGAVRHATLYILAAALAAGLGLWAAQNRFAPPPATPPPPLKLVTLFPATRALAPFRLQKSDGSAIVPASLKGHWTLVYLGYTHCPDVCPTTLQMLGMAGKSWATLPAAKRPRILFVSVDPKRDSPAHTGEYAHYFGKDIDGATADDKTLAVFARSLGMVYEIEPSTDGTNYVVDHSASISLVDPDGDMAGLIHPEQPPAAPFDPAAIGADMKALAEWR